MRIVLTGARGILGREMIRHRPEDVELVALGRDELDVRDRAAVRERILREQPDFVVHGAAMTAVDRCEEEVDLAFEVNALGSSHVAEACRDAGCVPVLVSTDYVFDGRSRRPYREFDPVNPLSVYGRSKWAGEEAVRQQSPRHLILRTQWVYGAGGKNFVDTMRTLAGRGQPLTVVADQVGCPTFAADLARGIYEVLRRDPGSGTYHLSAQGECSWFQFAAEIFRLSGRDVALSPCSTAQFPRPAPRPAHGVLANWRLERSGGDPMRPWQQGLAEYLRECGDLGPAGGTGS